MQEKSKVKLRSLLTVRVGFVFHWSLDPDPGRPKWSPKKGKKKKFHVWRALWGAVGSYSLSLERKNLRRNLWRFLYRILLFRCSESRDTCRLCTVLVRYRVPAFQFLGIISTFFPKWNISSRNIFQLSLKVFHSSVLFQCLSTSLETRSGTTSGPIRARRWAHIF